MKYDVDTEYLAVDMAPGRAQKQDEWLTQPRSFLFAVLVGFHCGSAE